MREAGKRAVIQIHPTLNSSSSANSSSVTMSGQRKFETLKSSTYLRFIFVYLFSCFEKKNEVAFRRRTRPKIYVAACRYCTSTTCITSMLIPLLSLLVVRPASARLSNPFSPLIRWCCLVETHFRQACVRTNINNSSHIIICDYLNFSLFWSNLIKLNH